MVASRPPGPPPRAPRPGRRLGSRVAGHRPRGARRADRPERCRQVDDPEADRRRDPADLGVRGRRWPPRRHDRARAGLPSRPGRLGQRPGQRRSARARTRRGGRTAAGHRRLRRHRRRHGRAAEALLDGDARPSGLRLGHAGAVGPAARRRGARRRRSRVPGPVRGPHRRAVRRRDHPAARHPPDVGRRQHL
jgi:hypothetical protein